MKVFAKLSIMFIPSKVYHHHHSFSTKNCVNDAFGILCWNINKNDNKKNYLKLYLKSLQKDYDFLLFQEANKNNSKTFFLPNFSFDAAANLEIRKRFFGVLTASNVASIKTDAYLSEGKEGLIGTYKSLLITKYAFSDGLALWVINIHAINFRWNRQFDTELERLIAFIAKHKGSMIIAGDFNAWNKTRLKKLNDLQERLALNMVPFKRVDSVKSFMGNQLDFILYKNLELIEFSVDKNQKLSDHNPLFAKFKKTKKDFYASSRF